MKRNGNKSKFLLTLLMWVSALLFAQASFSLSAVFPKNDSVITTQLQNKIAVDPLFFKLDLNINTSNAVVSYVGTVPTAIQASRLIELAESIAGVQMVNVSQLNVAQGNPLSPDDIISSLVIGLFMREGLKHAILHLRVMTVDGTVYLRGLAPDAATVNSAIGFAQTIPGVQKVESGLRVPNQ